MKKKKVYKIIIIIFAFLVLFLLGNIWTSSNVLTVKNYEYRTEKSTQDIRFVVLSDLHGHEFGKNNKKLVDKVREQETDFILLDGDFLNEDAESVEPICNLVKELSEFAPVYYALGNHEMAYIEKNNTDLLTELELAGAKVLEEDYIDFDINGTAFRLGGMYDYAFGLNGNDESSAIKTQTGDFLKEFQDTDRLKIMMAHRPDSFIFGDAASAWNIDLVVSGHNHGGQIVVPFRGGLYGGDQGWFPQYVHGMYEKDGMDIFVTSGLGSYSQKLPRFNNLPEIAVITVKAQ